jgi:hypothetical protein
VIFQVQEDAGAKLRDFANRFRSHRRKELVANLEHAHQIGYLARELHRCGQ